MCAPTTLLLLWCVCATSFGGASGDVTKSSAPIVVQALNPTGLRISVPDSPGTDVVIINANVNIPIVQRETGQVTGSVLEARDGFWTLEAKDITLKPGDVVFYWAYVTKGENGERREGHQAIHELVESNCRPSATSYNNGRTACAGKLLLEENFNSLNLSLWKHRIQFSDDPDLDFATYVDNPENSFVKDGKLHIKATVLTEDELLVHTKLEKCTWTRGGERWCERKPRGWDILPPTRSAMLTTKDTFSFKFGRLEIRAKTAAGDWLLSRRHCPYASGRVEALRSRGNPEAFEPSGWKLGALLNDPQIDIQTCSRTLYIHKNCPFHPGKRYSDEMHVFVVHWTPGLLLEPLAEVYGRAPAESGKVLISKIRGNANLVEPSGLDAGARFSVLQADISTCHRTLFIFKGCELNGKKYSDEMHLYSVIWTPESLKIRLDDCEHEVKPPHGSFLKHGYFKDNCENSPWEKGTHLVPFDQEFYVTLSLVPGGFGLHDDKAKTDGRPKSDVYVDKDPRSVVSLHSLYCISGPSELLEDQRNMATDMEIRLRSGLCETNPVRVDSAGTDVVIINANVNVPIVQRETGQVTGSVLEARDGFWMLETKDITLKIGDVVFYWVYTAKGDKGERREGHQAIYELVEPSCRPSVTTYNGRTACAGQLLLDENFNSLNLSLWKHRIQFSDDPHLDFATYVDNPENSFVKDGKLHIKATVLNEDELLVPTKLEKCTWTRGGAEWCERNPKGWGILPPTRSAQLTTRDNFSYKFGRLEIRAKAAVGDWLMSQLLLEPQAEVYGRAPAESGLMLISKIRGNQNLVSPEGRLEGASLSITQAHIATCHRILFIFKACELKGKKYSDEMHLYSVIWTPESLKIKLDDCNHEVKPPHGSFLKHGYFKDNCENSPWEKGTHLVPFDQEFYVSFKLIPGGFGLHHDVDITPNGKPKSAIYSEGDPKAPLSFWRHKEVWLPTWTSDLEVDSVKVWAL
ncbi:GNBP1 [Gryllus bimaculatus]|nr:GNBP1 [Gryllus bimaculatus]